MPKTLYPSLLLLFSTFSFSQRNITGVVTNEKEEPVIAATIAVLNPDSTLVSGTTTNAEGKFRLKLKNNKNFLRISCIGYKTKFVQPLNNDLIIVLEDALINIDEILVKSDKILLEAEKDIIIISNADRKNTATATEMISGLSRFNIDPLNHKIQTSDGEPVLVLLNGIETDEIKLLSLSPKEIQKIEYYQLPPGRFSNLNSTSVMNIITYKKRDKGMDININTGNSFTDIYGDNTVSIGLYDSINSLDFQYFIDYRNLNDIIQNQEYTYFDKNTTSLYQGRPGKYRRTNNRFSTEYKRNTDSNKLSAKFILRRSDGFENYTQNITQNEDVETRSRKLKDTYNSYALDIYNATYYKKDRIIGMNVVGTISDANSISDLSAIYTESSELNYEFEDINTNKGYSVIAEVFHTMSLNKVKWTVGVNNYYKLLKQTYNNHKETKIKRNRSYFYTGISGEIKNKIPYSFNIGFENTNASIETDEKQHQRMPVAKSSLSLLIPIAKKHKLRYASYLSSNVPSITEMAENYTYLDHALIYRGTSDISPYYVWGNRLNYQLTGSDNFYISPAVRYQLFFEPYQNAFIKEGDLIVKTYQTYDKLTDFYVSLSLNWKPLAFFNLQTTYGFSDVSLRSGNKKTENLIDQYFLTKLYFTHKNWKLSIINLEPYTNMDGEIITTYGRTLYTQLSYTRKNLNISGWFIHRPNQSSYRTASDIIDIKEEKTWNDLNSVIGIRLVYNLNIGNKRKKSVRKIVTNEDSSSGLSKNNTSNFE